MLGKVVTLDLAVTGFYIWKAKAENIQKNPKTHPYKDEPSSGENNTFGFGGYADTNNFTGTNYNDPSTMG
jgi:heat shock protein HslJ